MKYLLSVENSRYEELIDHYCVDLCENTSISQIDVLGKCWICSHAECQYEEQSITIAPGITLRKLDERRKMTETQESYGNTNYLSFFVSGIPLAQGRPRFRRAGKFVQTYDPATSKSWKESVRWQNIEYMRKEGKGMIEGAIEASLVFLLPRPKSLPKKVKDHIRKPDIENLVKSIFDALEGIAYKNDSQICKMTVAKLYESKIPGVSIILRGV